jgi:hypothetical protein
MPKEERLNLELREPWNVFLDFLVLEAGLTLFWDSVLDFGLLLRQLVRISIEEYTEG